MSGMIDVRLGSVGRAHGLKGEVAVHVSTDEPERRFVRGAQLRAGDRTVVVAGSRLHAGTMLLSFEGVKDRSAAEALRGLDLWASVPDDDVPTAADEFYDRVLVGMSVHDHAGTRVGTVSDVAHLPAHDSLQVQTADGEYLVPFVQALVPLVDIEAGVIHLADVGGLLGELGEAGES